VRLCAPLTAVNERGAYPPGVTSLLGEMLAAVAMVAEGIQFPGTVALQARGRGPLTTVLAECREQSLLRGIARWPDDGPPPTATALDELLGDAQLAITLTQPARPGERPVSYQGLIEAEGPDLAANLERYFVNSEQLPTRLFFAFAEEAGVPCVTGLLLQRLPAPTRATDVELDRLEESWDRLSVRGDALGVDELARLGPRALLSRLFPDHAVTLNPATRLEFSCSCSRDRSSNALRALPREELLELLESEGAITVTCEICGARYRYDPVDVHFLLTPGSKMVH